jgi:hypothetical protein
MSWEFSTEITLTVASLPAVALRILSQRLLHIPP